MTGDNLVGEILGERYEILDKIGTGGMATVYKAKDTLLNRNVAIKILRDSLEEEETVVNNFVKEAQASAGLAHNNIVSVYDVGNSDGLNYIVMELVEGITLKEYIKEKGMLPWQEACDYAIQIGQGISEAHANDIIHCDIKPQNIILTEDKTVKVTDFGIAKAVSSGTTVVGGTALGSVHYISPEQARGGHTDPRTDIYSMGIVLYEMLAGKVPFDGDSAVGIAMKHLEEEPVDVKCINLDIPTDLAYVVMKAISKEQSKRYQTVQEMLNDIHAVLASEPLPSKNIIDPDRLADTDDDEDSDEKAKEIQEELELRQRKAKLIKAREMEKKKRAQKRANRMATLLAIITIAVIGLIGTGVYMIVNNFVLNVSVPDFTNMTVEEAKQLAKDKHLKILDSDIEYSISDTVEDGKVVTQSPQKGKTAEKNSEVRIVVSIGSRGGNIAVPDLINKTRVEAMQMIDSAQLRATVIEENSKTVPAGNVIRQIPVSGTKLFAGDYVTIYLSKGVSGDTTQTGKTVVPYVTGVDIDVARNLLSDAGLTLGSVSSVTSDSAYGTVISQSVGAGNSVNSGSSIGIVISGGPAQEQEVYQEPEQENTNTQTGNNSTTGTQTFFVSIPNNGQDSVYVEVYVNGTLVHEGEYPSDTGTVPVDISGSGEVNVTAYVDGVAQSQTINFGN
ncbi:MAG: Stk1 family PASTA domain-containing Ser/Thr kinase [Clostridia bacterium]|nr:Stk1 family PASTA domain-containing Ser/Thr kinase [Clostridia bacterium]